MKPRLLSSAVEDDCRAAVLYARGCAKEQHKFAEEAPRRQDDTGMLAPELLHSSIYGFFGKSTLLFEGLRPKQKGTPHVRVQMGVPGCGKSTCLLEFLQHVFLEKLIALTGKRPSLLLSSVTNAQCNKKKI